MVSKVILSSILFLACSKEQTRSELEITMNFTRNTPKVERAEGRPDCPGTRMHEIFASDGLKFFKINWVSDTLKVGTFTGTFWYQNQGRSYSLYELNVEVASYHDNMVRGHFYGGIVSGEINNLKFIQK